MLAFRVQGFKVLVFRASGLRLGSGSRLHRFNVGGRVCENRLRGRLLLWLCKGHTQSCSTQAFKQWDVPLTYYQAPKTLALISGTPQEKPLALEGPRTYGIPRHVLLGVSGSIMEIIRVTIFKGLLTYLLSPCP